MAATHLDDFSEAHTLIRRGYPFAVCRSYSISLASKQYCGSVFWVREIMLRPVSGRAVLAAASALSLWAYRLNRVVKQPHADPAAPAVSNQSTAHSQSSGEMDGRPRVRFNVGSLLRSIRRLSIRTMIRSIPCVLASHVLAAFTLAGCAAGQPPFCVKITYDKKRDAVGHPFESRPNAPLRRLAQPSLIEPRLALTGMFTDSVDAATIILCEDGRRLPVALEGDYRPLEKGYRQVGSRLGQASLVNLEGRIAARPSMKERRPPHSTLIAECFANILLGETDGQAPAGSSLRGTYWKLVRLNREAVDAADRQQEPYLIFATHDTRVAGSGGCNRVTGSFELDGDELHLGQMVATKMACRHGMDLEQQFLRALEKVKRYRIRGSHLDMLDGAGTVIARFEAVVLR